MDGECGTYYHSGNVVRVVSNDNAALASKLVSGNTIVVKVLCSPAAPWILFR
jgi:hypothetical protein